MPKVIGESSAKVTVLVRPLSQRGLQAALKKGELAQMRSFWNEKHSTVGSVLTMILRGSVKLSLEIVLDGLGVDGKADEKNQPWQFGDWLLGRGVHLGEYFGRECLSYPIMALILADVVNLKVKWPTDRWLQSPQLFRCL